MDIIPLVRAIIIKDKRAFNITKSNITPRIY